MVQGSGLDGVACTMHHGACHNPMLCAWVPGVQGAWDQWTCTWRGEPGFPQQEAGTHVDVPLDLV